MMSKLSDRRGLARSVDADDEDDTGALRDGQAAIAVSRDELGHNFLESLDELLLRRGLALFKASDDLDRRRNTDIGLDERLLDPLPRSVISWIEQELLRESAPAARE